MQINSFFHTGKSGSRLPLHKMLPAAAAAVVICAAAPVLQTQELSAADLAKNIAAKVKRNRSSVALEPMNPYERRIIHSALQNDRYVTTHSEGEEPYRRVVITPKH